MAKIKRNAAGKILRNVASKIVNECGALVECTNCIGQVMPQSKVATIAGVADGACVCAGVNGSKIMTAQGAGSCRLTFDVENFCGADALNIQLEFNPASIDFFLNIGALTGQVHFQRIPSVVPYNCSTEANGSYTLVSNTSGQCDFTGMAVTIA